jgi:hypothetical protein
MAQRNAGVPADRRIELRIGIHVGDIIIEEFLAHTLASIKIALTLIGHVGDRVDRGRAVLRPPRMLLSVGEVDGP